MIYWPLFCLLAPFAVTVFSGRSVWLWWSLAIGLGSQWLLLNYVSEGWLDSGTNLLLDKELFASHLALSRVKNISGFALYSFVIGALLWLPRHHRHTIWDTLLFWATITCVSVSYFAVSTMVDAELLTTLVEPSFEASRDFRRINNFVLPFNLLTLVFLVTAALRPIISSLRAKFARP